MGCCDLEDVWEANEMWAGYNFILSYMSTIPYLIVMGNGWVLQIRAPENQLILTAAIVTTIPIICIALYTCFACVFLKLYSSDIRLKDHHIIHSWNCIKSFTLTVLSRASTHGRSQLKRQNLGVGGYMEGGRLHGELA